MQTLAQLLPILLLFPILYFLLIRPQKKKDKEINQMRSNIKVGDEVVTIGGICGKIVKTKEDTLIIQVGADKVKFEIMRWSISRVTAPAKSTKADSAPAPEADGQDSKVTAKRIKKLEKPAEKKEAAEESVSLKKAPEEEKSEA